MASSQQNQAQESTKELNEASNVPKKQKRSSSSSKSSQNIPRRVPQRLGQHADESSPRVATPYPTHPDARSRAEKGRERSLGEELRTFSSDQSESGTVIRHGSNELDARKHTEDYDLQELLEEKTNYGDDKAHPIIRESPCKTVSQVFPTSLARACRGNLEAWDQSEEDHNAKYLSQAKHSHPVNFYQCKDDIPGNSSSELPDYSENGSDKAPTLPATRRRRTAGFSSTACNDSSQPGNHSESFLEPLLWEERHGATAGNDYRKYGNGEDQGEPQDPEDSSDSSSDVKWHILSESSELISNQEARRTRIPGCTAPAGRDTWRITDSTLKAYVALRGPQPPEGTDEADLLDWMESCIGFHKPKPLDGYMDHIDSANNSFDNQSSSAASDGTLASNQVYTVPRASVEHIEAPVGFNPVEHEATSGPAPDGYIRFLRKNFKETWSTETDQLHVPLEDIPSPSSQDEFYVSDDEENPLEGRISPCTFRMWAQGCRKWDTDKLRDVFGLNTNGFPDISPSHSKSPTEASWDPLTGSRVEKIEDWQHNLHDHTTGVQRSRPVWQPRAAPATYAEPKRAHATFTDAEVRSALLAKDAPRLHGFPARHAERALQEGMNAMNYECLNEIRLSTQRLSAEARITARKKQLQRVTSCVEYILQRQTQEKWFRQNEIYRHVAGHIKDVEDRVEEMAERNRRRHRNLEELAVTEKQLEERVREEARRVGVTGESDLGEIERMVQRLTSHQAVIDDEDESFF